MATKRRHRLTAKGGVECYEVRLVTSLTPEGGCVTNCEVTVPDNSDLPSLSEVLGALRLSELLIVRMYEEDDE